MPSAADHLTGTLATAQAVRGRALRPSLRPNRLLTARVTNLPDARSRLAATFGAERAIGVALSDRISDRIQWSPASGMSTAPAVRVANVPGAERAVPGPAPGRVSGQAQWSPASRMFRAPSEPPGVALPAGWSGGIDGLCSGAEVLGGRVGGGGFVGGRWQTRGMKETVEELSELQRLLDASHQAATAHLRSIITRQVALTAEELVRALSGMRTINLATVTARGEPRISAVDGHFLHAGCSVLLSPPPRPSTFAPDRPQASRTSTASG